jgi:monofunctional glycosyltransferase
MLAAAIVMISAGILLNSLPGLDGVEQGVFIKIKQGEKKYCLKFISPRSPDFVFSAGLPGYVTGAIITSEDEDFYSHNGINMNEIFEAAEYDLRNWTLKCGGSTITQQVVKNVYLNGEKSFRRKIIEALTALRLERKLSKKQILDYYINMIEFGSGIYGIRQASSRYFNKAPEKLTPREAAILAVIMPRPKIRGRALLEQKQRQFQERRVTNLLARMKENGYIGG